MRRRGLSQGARPFPGAFLGPLSALALSSLPAYIVQGRVTPAALATSKHMARPHAVHKGGPPQWQTLGVRPRAHARSQGRFPGKALHPSLHFSSGMCYPTPSLGLQRLPTSPDLDAKLGWPVDSGREHKGRLARTPMKHDHYVLWRGASEWRSFPPVSPLIERHVLPHAVSRASKRPQVTTPCDAKLRWPVDTRR